MTNLRNLVVSTGTYELWETDQKGVFGFIRRDSCELRSKDLNHLQQLWDTYNTRLRENGVDESDIATDYVVEFDSDNESIIVVRSSVSMSSNESPSDKEEEFSDESEAPSAEEIAAFLEQKRRDKTILGRIKKFFGR